MTLWISCLRLGEDLYKRNCHVDAHKGDLDVEDRELISQLFGLFLGNPSQGVGPASPRLKSKILGLLSKSLTAADYFPQNIEVGFICLHPITS